jgi:hypothetical protein
MEHAKIQSIIFDQYHWTEKEAKHWLKKHGHTTNFKGKGTDITSDSYRFRQHKPLSKSLKDDGWYYTTEHPGPKGVAYVIINEPKSTGHGKSRKATKSDSRSNLNPRVAHDGTILMGPHSGLKMKYIDVGDQLMTQGTYGMTNTPLEQASNVGPINDGDPNHRYIHAHILKYPTLETLKLVDKDLFSHFEVLNN